MRAPKQEPSRSFVVRGRRFTDTLTNAVRDLTAGQTLWEVTPDGFIPLAQRFVDRLALNHERLTTKEVSTCSL